MIDKEGMIILLVNSESPASKAGAKAGDILYKINGNVVNTINDFNQRIQLEGNYSFIVIRNGEEITLSVKLR